MAVRSFQARLLYLLIAILVLLDAGTLISVYFAGQRIRIVFENMLGQEYDRIVVGSFDPENPTFPGFLDPGAWVFEGLGFRAGQVIGPDVIGPEFDRAFPGSSPKNLQVLAHSPVRVGRRASFADTTAPPETKKRTGFENWPA